MSSRYLLHFAHEHIPFRWPEFLALTTKNGCRFTLISNETHLQTRPYIMIELKDARQEGSLIRSVSESFQLKGLYEVWAHSNVSIRDLAIRASRSRYFLDEEQPHWRTTETFRISCQSFGCKLSQTTKISMIKELFFAKDFKARLDLGNPTQTYVIIEVDENNISDSQVTAKEYYFCRHLVKSNRSKVDRFSLKRRVFIANTSMEPLIGFTAANMAQVRSNDLVYDPFVGSGSLLVAAAYMGAYVFGSDIDWMLLHGKSKPTRHSVKLRQEGEGVRANLRQYNLEDQYIDVMVSDISRCCLQNRFSIDAIITDPPYGIRESSEKIGSRRPERQIASERDANRLRFPSKVQYGMSELLTDLLNFSATHLKIGGRLVFYLPVTFTSDDQSFRDFIPAHPCLNLVAYCEQPMTKRSFRLMITMEKIRQPPLDSTDIDLPRALCAMNLRNRYFNENKDFCKS